MRRVHACLLPVLFLSACAWEGVPLFWWHKSALRNAQVLELYSLSAVSGSAGDQVKIEGHLRGHPVLGKAVVSDPARRERLVATLEKAVASSSGEEPACFFPRHAIRTVRDG